MMNSGGMMKSWFISFLAAAIAVVLPALAFSQDTYFQQYLDFNTLGGGARAAGMGGAFLGISDGEYSYAWNPAGMVFNEKRTIGLQFNSAADKFQFDYTSYSYSLMAYDVNQAEAKRSHFNLDNSGFVVPFSFYDRQWAVGGGFRNIQDLDFKFDAPGLFGSRDITTEKLGIDAISVGVSGKITDNIGVGITGNDYIRGGEDNHFFGKSYEFYFPANPIPDTVDVWENYTSTFSGVNFDVGLMGQFSMFKGGFVLHTPYDLKQDVKLTYQFMIPPAPAGIIERYTATTNIPFAYSAGLSVKPMEALVVAADFDSHPMSKSKIKYNYEMSSIQDETVDPQWEDLNQFRVGVEYTLNAGFANIPLRVGFRNNPAVVKKLTAVNEALTDSGLAPQLAYGGQETTNILTFGSGLRFQRAWIDLAYQFGSSSYDFNYNWRVPVTETYKEKRDYSRLFISAGMNF
jgi:hypothetical protein